MTVLEPVVAFLQDYTGKKVSLGQVVAGAERPRRPVLRVMDRLVRENYLEEIEDNPLRLDGKVGGKSQRNPTWRILAKPLSADFIPMVAARVTVRDRMWKLVRAMRRFTVAEIMRLSGASEGAATDFVNLLAAYGYVRMIGKDGHRHVYMLIKDPGVKRPATPEVRKNAQRKSQGDPQQTC